MAITTNGSTGSMRHHLLVGCTVLLLASLTGCGQEIGQSSVAAVTAAVTPAPSASPAPSSAPSSAPMTMSAGVQALEQAMRADGRSIGAPVLIKGSFALAPVTADEVVAVSAEQALRLASGQATFGSLRSESPTVQPVIRLALFSQYPPGSTDLPEGASTTQRAAWIIALERIPGPARHGGPADPDAIQPTSRPPIALVDAVVSVDATSGAVGGVYLLG